MCAELRIKIYCYLFAGATALVRNIHDFKKCERVSTYLWSINCHKNILSTCKTIYLESKPILADSMLLIMGPPRWKASDIFTVLYPEKLTTYLLRIRRLRLEDPVFSSRQMNFDVAQLPTLEILDLVGVGRDLHIEVDISHDDEAVSIIEGRQDQRLVECWSSATLKPNITFNILSQMRTLSICPGLMTC